MKRLLIIVATMSSLVQCAEHANMLYIQNETPYAVTVSFLDIKGEGPATIKPGQTVGNWWGKIVTQKSFKLKLSFESQKDWSSASKDGYVSVSINPKAEDLLDDNGNVTLKIAWFPDTYYQAGKFPYIVKKVKGQGISIVDWQTPNLSSGIIKKILDYRDRMDRFYNK